MTGNAHDLELLRTSLAGYRIRFGTEEQMQADAAAALESECYEFEREYQLGKAGRIDFYLPVERIGIECKTDGSASAVLAQLLRYAGHEAFLSLLLVTRRRTHMLAVNELSDKPFAALWVGASSL